MFGKSPMTARHSKSLKTDPFLGEILPLQVSEMERLQCLARIGYVCVIAIGMADRTWTVNQGSESFLQDLGLQI
jgi:hypothetical protein